MDYIIIVAGGKGLRMGSDIPKQFLPIGGKPVLMRTLERFREYSAELQIILVLPEAQQAYWRELCKQYNFPLPLEGAEGGFYQLANGGQTRFHSVQNGLAKVPDDAQGVVGVHDGVRPFPSIEVIKNCYETARTKKAANRQPYNDGFTDDASVVESYGYEITLVEGNRENIKITTPYDLKIAEVLI